METDKYKTITKTSQGLFKDKGSRFISYAIPVTSESEVKSHLAAFKKEYYDARHHCYAYRLGYEKLVYRANDDGEPSSTAGKPILGQIQSHDLTDVLIVVIRYFGGTLLGVGGLINAYKEAAIDALSNANIIEKVVKDYYSCSFDYADMNSIMRIVKEEKIKDIRQDFTDRCIVEMGIPALNVEKVLGRLDKLLGVEVTFLRRD